MYSKKYRITERVSEVGGGQRVTRGVKSSLGAWLYECECELSELS